MISAYHRPTSLSETIRLLQTHENAWPVAGATDLGVMLRRRVVEIDTLIDVSRLPELRRLEADGSKITIGAAVTHREIERSPIFVGPLSALPVACSTVGATQTRNVGTLGGNLCNASPAADIPPVLMVFGAAVEIAGPGGRRDLSVEDFLTGYRQTALRSGELLAAIRIPRPPVRSGSAFFKQGRRGAMEISVVSAAASVEMTEDGRLSSVRVAVGSVAPTAVRARAVEDRLVGVRPDSDAIAVAAVAVEDHIDPIDDVRASASYRRRIAPVLVRRALAAAIDAAQGKGS